MNQYYPDYKRNKKKEIIKKLMITDDKMYKLGAILGHLYTAGLSGLGGKK